MKIRHVFRKIAHATASAIGSPYAFILAVLAIVIWAVCGPVFHYSDTWQLVINTSTTIVTFLVVFMIQNSQNRDSQAVHLKLDELICAVKAARNRLVDVEDLDDDEIARLALEFRARRDQASPRAAAAHDENDDDDDDSRTTACAACGQSARTPDEPAPRRRTSRVRRSVANLPSEDAQPGAPNRPPSVSARQADR